MIQILVHSKSYSTTPLAAHSMILERAKQQVYKNTLPKTRKPYLFKAMLVNMSLSKKRKNLKRKRSATISKWGWRYSIRYLGKIQA